MYEIIYADPPWSFSNKKTGGSMKSGSAAQYSCMSIKELASLNVQSLCAENCALFMWWVASMPDEALHVARSWGFKFKTMTEFVWNKTTVHGKPFFGMGFSTRQGSESCLLAVKGDFKRISASVRAVITHPILAHSEKPDIFRDSIVELMGPLPRLEMFGRKAVPGWDMFGDEVPDSIEIPAVTRIIMPGKIKIGAYTFDNKCPQSCPGHGEGVRDYDLCRWCPIFNCGPEGTIVGCSPKEYRVDWAAIWHAWFGTDMKDYPQLSIVNIVDSCANALTGGQHENAT